MARFYLEKWEHTEARRLGDGEEFDDEFVIVVVGILAIGIVLGWSLLLLERFRLLGKRKNVRERLERLLADGFVPLQCQLRRGGSAR